MKFLAVFVTLAAVAFGYPATTTWTLNELSDALQNPTTDPVLIPYLEAALNVMMYSLHHGHAMDSITIDMPIVADYTLKELETALKDPNTNPAHIQYLEDAMDKIVEALFSGIQMESITVVLPVALPTAEPEFIDVWPVQIPEVEPEFVDVWPIQIEEAGPSPAAPAPVKPVAPAPASSPLVQIIVNVQQDSAPAVVDSPVQVDHVLRG